MTTEQQAADESRSQAARLDQFLGWLLPTILGFAALEGVAGLAFADAPTLGTTLILVAYAALIWMARSLARRARMGAAVVVTCAGLLAASIGVVLLQPSLYPTLTIVPLLVVAVALPYVGGRRLIRLLVGCWLVTILVAVLGQTLTDQAAIPAWFAGLFYTSALAAASAMVLLLLWQFSDRLSEALGRLEAQRERLHVTLHSIGDGVIATDTAGTVTLLNPIAEALTGWPRDEAVGRPFGEVFPIISEVTRAPAVDPIATVLSTGARVGLANHTVLVARDGVERSIADSAAPIRDHGNRLHGVVVVFHDVTERQRAERDQRLLVAAGAALAGSLEAQVVAQRLTDLATPDLADLCIVDLLLEDGSIQRPAAAHRDPAQARFVVRGSTPRFPPRLDASVGVGKVLRTGESEFYPVVPVGMLDTLAQDAEHLQLLRRLGFASYLVAPLVARGRTLGALSCMRAEAGRRYTTADLALAEELARRAALAIDNAQLYTAERQARAEAEAAHQRLTILAEAGAALAASLDVEATLATITHLIVPRLADWAVVWWRAAAPGETPALRPVAPVHRDPRRVSLLDELHRHSLAADRFGGVGRVLGAGEPELVAAIDDDHLQRVAGDSDYLRVLRALGPRSHLMLPLAARGQVLGVLAMVQAESGRRYGPDDLALGRELAARAALALDNARLYQAEQAARRHLAVLAEAGAALTASLDFEATLARVARLVVPALADWCTVDLVEEDEPVGLRRLAAVHADPAKEALVARLVDYPPRPPAEHPVLTVVRTGQPTLGVDVPDGVIEAAARDAEHLALVRAIGMRSFMIVPLRVRERVLGAISLVAAESGRRYGPDDLALAEQLAERAALAIDNARLYREARAAVRIREEFLAVASHELRTPLTSVKGYVQLLDRQVRGDDGPLARLRGIIDPLHTQVRRLEMLVGDLLDVSRLQQGRLELRPELVELGELARQVVARFEHAPHRTPRHALVVAAPAPVTGTWDAARLDQVLTNLVGNALKFSPTGGEVRVMVRQEGGEALLTVSDEGLGIGPDERATLFQPFQRGEATARAIPGVGLGLYIASEIVARHGGRIEVASAVGEGSTFVVRLPLAD